MPRIYDYLLDTLREKTKTSTTVKCEILKVLGLMIKAFTNQTSTRDQYDKIVRFSFVLLEKQFEANSDPELSIIAGCFSCLDRCLFFLGNFPQTSIKFDTLYACLFKSIKVATSGDVVRYAMANKALRLLKHHAGSFKQLIALNITPLHKVILSACQAETKSMQKHAGDCMQSILVQLSRYMVENPQHPKEFLSGLVAGYCTELSKTPPSSTYEILLAVGGLSATAPALMLLNPDQKESQQFVIQRVLGALIKSSAYINSSSQVANVFSFYLN